MTSLGFSSGRLDPIWLIFFPMACPLLSKRFEVAKGEDTPPLFLRSSTTFDYNSSVTWRGTNVSGRAMPSGTYVVRLETESGVEARKVMLVR